MIPPQEREIRVDQDCRIYEVVPHTGGVKQHVYTDHGICDVGDTNASSRGETNVNDGKRSYRIVTILEHTFTLHNPTLEPVTFVLEQRIKKGWEIDSDPAPAKISGTIAMYLIRTQPDETVSLHVGERNPPRRNYQAPAPSLEKR